MSQFSLFFSELCCVIYKMINSCWCGTICLAKDSVCLSRFDVKCSNGWGSVGVGFNWSSRMPLWMEQTAWGLKGDNAGGVSIPYIFRLSRILGIAFGVTLPEGQYLRRRSWPSCMFWNSKVILCGAGSCVQWSLFLSTRDVLFYLRSILQKFTNSGSEVRCSFVAHEGRMLKGMDQKK